MEKLVLQGITRFFHRLLNTRKWQRVWSREWVLKFASLLFATLLWYFVGGEDTVDQNVMMPIEIINLPRDLVISNQFKREIEVTVSGPRKLIQELTTRKVTRQINLSNARAGTNVIENNNESIVVPRGITVLRIQPSSVILSLDKLIQKQFAVVPIRVGKVAPGYMLDSLKMEPDVISITGPATVLSNVDELRTSLVNIEGMKESRQLQVPLDLEPKIIGLIGETTVTADIKIKPKMVQKKLTGVKVDTNRDGTTRLILPDTVDVIAKIPVILQDEYTNLEEIISVTAYGEEQGGFVTVNVASRQGIEPEVEVVAVVPKFVQVVDPVTNKAPQQAKDNKPGQQSVLPQVQSQPKAEDGEQQQTGVQQPSISTNTDGLQVIPATKKKIKKKL